MISKWRIASLIGLCLVSTLTCGFSSWIYVVNNSTDVGDINVNVGNVTTNSTATIVFQKAELFSFNKYGFAHEEKIEVDVNGHKQTETITYFDYSYSISSIWKVNTKETTSFKYEIGQKYIANTFTFFPKEGGETFSIESYSDYDTNTGALSNPITGASANKATTTSATVSYNLTLPSSSSYQYISMVYSYTLTIPAESDFENTVFIPCTTALDERKQPRVVTFSFKLNKVGV